MVQAEDKAKLKGQSTRGVEKVGLGGKAGETY